MRGGLSRRPSGGDQGQVRPPLWDSSLQRETRAHSLPGEDRVGRGCHHEGRQNKCLLFKPLRLATGPSRPKQEQWWDVPRPAARPRGGWTGTWTGWPMCLTLPDSERAFPCGCRRKEGHRSSRAGRMPLSLGAAGAERQWDTEPKLLERGPVGMTSQREGPSGIGRCLGVRGAQGLQAHHRCSPWGLRAPAPLPCPLHSPSSAWHPSAVLCVYLPWAAQRVQTGLVCGPRPHLLPTVLSLVVSTLILGQRWECTGK